MGLASVGRLVTGLCRFGDHLSRPLCLVGVLEDIFDCVGFVWGPSGGPLGFHLGRDSVSLSDAGAGGKANCMDEHNAQ